MDSQELMLNDFLYDVNAKNVVKVVSLGVAPDGMFIAVKTANEKERFYEKDEVTEAFLVTIPLTPQFFADNGFLPNIYFRDVYLRKMEDGNVVSVSVGEKGSFVHDSCLMKCRFRKNGCKMTDVYHLQHAFRDFGYDTFANSLKVKYYGV